LLGCETPCCAAFIIFLYLLLRFWNQILTCNNRTRRHDSSFRSSEKDMKNKK
jgi:hypothetical protein